MHLECSLSAEIKNSHFWSKRTFEGSMVPDVFTLHKIVGGDEVTFPFSPQDYQRYVFGDGKLAHRFGVDLAKALLAHSPGFRVAQPPTSSPTDDVAVAVLTGHVPTSTHSLRNHFVAYLNRRLIADNARPALKIDIHTVGKDKKARDDLQPTKSEAFRIDAEHLGKDRTIIVLADIRTSQDREDRIQQSFNERNLANRILFVYLVDGLITTALWPILSYVINPSLKDVETISQAPNFEMNGCFVQFLLGRDYAEFCQFIRRQDDCFTRLLLEYAICGRYYDDEDHQYNVEFLQWEVEARESM
jgi:hypothetical protein